MRILIVYLFITLLPLVLNVLLIIYAFNVFKQINVNSDAAQSHLDQMALDIEVQRLLLVSEGVL